jgi:hypothetical protein
MRLRRFIAIALAALAATAVAATTAGAQGQTFKPGEFSVDMPMPGESGAGGKQPDCTPAIETIALTGGTTKCTMTNVITANTAEGTVANATLAAEYGDAFNRGTITRTCDMTQRATMDMTFAAGAMMSGGRPTMKMSGEMTISCAWKMTFSDDKSSSLSGTMEVSAKISDKNIGDQGVSTADIEMTLKVFVTEGTGLFEGYTGSGTMDATQGIDFLGGGAGGGGNPGTPPPTSTPTPPTGGGGQIPDAQCQAAGLPAGCTPQQYCQANPSACQGFSPRLAALPSTRQAEGDSMTLTLVKSAGSVRIISPLPTAGTKAAKVSNKTRVKIVATKGAVCTVKSNTGKTVGKATSKDSARVITLKAKKGSLAKAKSIQATCTLGGKKFSSAKVKVKVKVKG